ncbi:hypothetical protein BHM03_00030646 [Ensete ventricosum]|nr:hypothetical protein BHM03_00030646 [Ensete ventricosum]
MSLGAMLFLPIESQSSPSLADSQPQPCLRQLLGPTLLLSTPPAMLLLRLLGFCFLLPDLIFGQSLLPLNDSVESSGFHPLTRRQSVPLWQQSPTATLLLLRGALAARPSPARDPVLLPGDCGLYVQVRAAYNFTNRKALQEMPENGIRLQILVSNGSAAFEHELICCMRATDQEQKCRRRPYRFRIFESDRASLSMHPWALPTNVTRLCRTRSIVTVNGKFPGPKIMAREGDRVVVKVVNHVTDNVTIHWHGVRQLRTGWYDGPAYVTQCPIRTGRSFVYNFTIAGQRGTLFWHAHISWMRATLYGPIVVLPKRGVPYPFPKPYKEIPIIFADTFELKVKPGKTYLLRMINAALNDELFFSIANHTLTVVDVDAIYVKPFDADIVHIAPGQTTNVLLHTKPSPPDATFLMAARPYATGPGTFDNTTTAGLLVYLPPNASSSSAHVKNLPFFRPTLPALNDTAYTTNYTGKLRSLASAQFPANVPQTVERRFYFTVGLGTNPCAKNQTCQGPNGTKFAASVNNISFALPTSAALLQAHYFGRTKGVYDTDFPDTPPFPFNYTGTPPNDTFVTNATKVVVLPFNTSVELVMQDTSIQGAESHPLHFHGFNFFVVGTGLGNYDPSKDPKRFNLADPIERNTVGVPVGGWVAIRFLADNPELDVTCMHACRSLVHALSPGSAHELGVEDGVGGQRWGAPQPEAASSAVRSPQMLTVDHHHLLPVLSASSSVLGVLYLSATIYLSMTKVFEMSSAGLHSCIRFVLELRFRSTK